VQESRHQRQVKKGRSQGRQQRQQQQDQRRNGCARGKCHVL